MDARSLNVEIRRLDLRSSDELDAALTSVAKAHSAWFPFPDYPDALTAASTVSASLVSPMIRHHAESALNSLGSSGPTSFALSVLALFSASMMSSDRAGAASLGSGLAARRLPTPDAAPGVVGSWSRIRTIVSCGRTTITTPEPFLGFASLRRLAVEAHSGVAVTAASTAAASEPRRMARHQSRNVVKSSRRRCPTRFPSPIRVLSSLAFSSAETMFSGSFDNGFVACIGRFVPTSACSTRARASPSMN
jgi:hypothetical protein